MDELNHLRFRYARIWSSSSAVSLRVNASISPMCPTYMRSELPTVGVVPVTCAAPSFVVRPPTHTNSTFTFLFMQVALCAFATLCGVLLSLR